MFLFPVLRLDTGRLEEHLETLRDQKDKLLVGCGIHKDELNFTIHGMVLKKFGSQGQQKSFLIALKLAQYTFLFRQKGFEPLLLLDDIFDKLDDARTTKLMKMVSDKDFGQIFITDTSRKRIEAIFSELDVPVSIFDIENGNIVV
jgi:DNA replication and repair protein RecF